MVIRDRTHPDFPHGTRKGRERGCGCDRCRRAYSRAAAVSELNRINGVKTYHCRVDVTPAREHIHALRAAVPRLSYAAIARCVGISPPAVRDIATGTTTSVKAGVAHAILKTTAEQAATATGYQPAGPIVDMVRRTQAAGWAMSWWVEQANHNMNFTHGATGWLLMSVAHRMRAIADEIGDRYATPENSGLTPYGIGRAKRTARELGYHPAVCYDDDGNYAPRLDPEHPWSIADSRCGELMETAARLTRAGRDPEVETIAAIAARFGTYERAVERVAKKLGIGVQNPRRTENLARVRDVLARVDSGEMDVVQAAADLGLASWGGNFATIPRDHPAIASMVKERAEARRVRKANGRAEAAERAA